ncbi:MAG: reductase [Pseudonocardiales bacterium]|nr:reductase [Pseudonocardiales bacterium]
MTDVVILNGNPRIGSRTGVLAAALAAALGSPDPQVIELAGAVAVGFGPEPVSPPSPQPDALDVITRARLLLVATPSYKGTYTGLLKVFLDQLPTGALDGVVAVPVAVAGSPAHAEATAADLLRLLRELGATAPSAVAVLESQLGDLAAIAARHAGRLTDEFARV